MDAQDILKTLNNLEKSLQNVESARQQVAHTVDAYEGAKSQLHALAEEFSVVSAELKEVYTAINKNASSLDMTLHNKFEEVFNNITCKTQELQHGVINIQSAFKDACNQTAQSMEGSVDNCLLKLSNEIDAALIQFSKKAQLETDSITATLSEVKSSALQMQKDFNHAISAVVVGHKETQEKIASDFGTSISNHISSFKLLNEELQNIIDKYEEVNSLFEAKIDQIFDFVKKKSDSLALEISNLQVSQKTEYDDLSKRLDIIDSEQDKLISAIPDLKDCLNKASSLIVKQQTDAIANTENKFVGEINSLKEQLASSRKLTMLCFIAIVISVIFNFLVFIK